MYMAEETTKPDDPMEERLARIEKTIDKLTDIVVAVSEKGRLTEQEKKMTDPSLRKYAVSTYNDKLVVSWSALLANRVSKDENKKWVEKQTTELTYQDGTKELVDYSIWQRDKIMESAVFVSESTNRGGRTTLTLENDKRGVFEIGLEFVN